MVKWSRQKKLRRTGRQCKEPIYQIYFYYVHVLIISEKFTCQTQRESETVKA